MKANQNFREAEEAVSPVIGVILMVAITVVLAAVVFVLVSGIGGDSESAPNVQFQTDETADRIEVVRADADANWNRILVKSSTATAVTEFTLDVASGATGGTNVVVVAAGTLVKTATDTILATEFLEFCGTAAQTDLTITLIDQPTNSKIGEYKFQTVAICA